MKCHIDADGTLHIYPDGSTERHALTLWWDGGPREIQPHYRSGEEELKIHMLLDPDTIPTVEDAERKA